MLARLTQTDLTVMITGEVGHRQGARRPRAARIRQAPQRPLRRHQHGGHPARADRVRAVRPREGRLHRRAEPPHRPLRAGRRRHAVSRRDRRHADGGADATAARAPGRRIHDGRRPHADPDQCQNHRRHQSRPAAADRPGPVPRGSVLPAERRAAALAAPARAARGHSRSRAPLPWRSPRRRGCRPRASSPRRSSGSSATTGREICASSRTSCAGCRRSTRKTSSPCEMVENELATRCPAAIPRRCRADRRSLRVRRALPLGLFHELRAGSAAVRALYARACARSSSRSSPRRSRRRAATRSAPPICSG